MATEPDVHLEAPIWWDPKVRSSIWDPRTFRLGLLLVRDETLLVVTARGLLCSGRLDEFGLGWPGVFDLPMCDLTLGTGLFRLYFCSPHPRGPQFHARIPIAVAAVLEAREGRRVRLATARTPAARWPSQLTEPMGRKRMTAFRLLVEGADGRSPAPGPDTPPDPGRSPVATSAPPEGMSDGPDRGSQDGRTAPSG